MSRCNQSGTKSPRQNQHQRRYMQKIARHNKRGWKVDGLEKELALSMGDTKRPMFRTGRDSDARLQRGRGDE